MHHSYFYLNHIVKEFDTERDGGQTQIVNMYIPNISLSMNFFTLATGPALVIAFIPKSIIMQLYMLHGLKYKYKYY